MEFNENPIKFAEIIDKTDTENGLTGHQNVIWKNRRPTDKSSGDVVMRIRGELSGFTNPIVHSNEICPTVNAQGGSFMVYDLPRHINQKEVCCVGTYPQDYKFKELGARYLIGMSVPPVMTAQIANQLYLQWFKS